MNSSRIQQMCNVMPSPEEDRFVNNYRMERSVSAGQDDYQTTRFLTAYKDLQFGWRFAQTMAFNECSLGISLRKDDAIIWKAFCFNRDHHRFRDRTFLWAKQFIHPIMAKEKAIIDALLVAPNATVESVAEAMNLPEEVVAAYETLFFNVLDRKSDHLFISSIVYPKGRIVEYYDRYVYNETFDNLLMRAGYNNGAYDMLYLAGFPSDALAKYDNKDTPARLEALFMANGLVQARNGWMNQGPATSVGVYQARQILQAAKASGVDSTESPFFDKNPGRAILADIHRHRSMTLKRRQDYMKTIPVDATVTQAA